MGRRLQTLSVRLTPSVPHLVPAVGSKASSSQLAQLANGEAGPCRRTQQLQWALDAAAANLAEAVQRVMEGAGLVEWRQAQTHAQKQAQAQAQDRGEET